MGCGKSESAAPTNAAARHSTTAPTTTLSAAEERALEQKLNGVWVAEDVDAALGTVKVRLTFREEGPMKLAAWSDIPFVGQVRDRTAPYEVHGNVISSEAIRDGTTVEDWLRYPAMQPLTPSHPRGISFLSAKTRWTAR